MDQIWSDKRPARPNETVKIHPAEYAGKPFQEKIADLRKELKTKKRAGFIVCRSFLDSIIYLNNIILIMQQRYLTRLRGCSTLEETSMSPPRLKFSPMANDEKYPIQSSLLLICSDHPRHSRPVHRRRETFARS